MENSGADDLFRRPRTCLFQSESCRHHTPFRFALQQETRLMLVNQVADRLLWISHPCGLPLNPCACAADIPIARSPCPVAAAVGVMRLCPVALDPRALLALDPASLLRGGGGRINDLRRRRRGRDERSGQKPDAQPHRERHDAVRRRMVVRRPVAVRAPRLCRRRHQRRHGEQRDQKRISHSVHDILNFLPLRLFAHGPIAVLVCINGAPRLLLPADNSQCSMLF